MDTEDYEAEESNLVKDLRKQIAEATKRAKAAEDERDSMKSQFRERSVADVLSSKGVNPKVARFIPVDVDGEEAISDWLEENQDVFGFQVQETQGSPVSDETKAQLSQANRLAESAVSPDKIADIESRISNAGSLEEINAALAEFQKFQL